MDLTPTPEQKDLRSTARDFLAARSPVGSAAAEPAAATAELWNAIADLGWLGVSAPESSGGIGLGLVEETILAEETGRALLAEPWLPTVGLALPLLLAAGAEDLAAGVVAGERRATLAWIDPGAATPLAEAATAPSAATLSAAGRLQGGKAWVPDGEGADLVLVLASRDGRPAVAAVEAAASEVSAEPVEALDLTRPLATLRFADAPARELELAPAALEAALARALALFAAESVGIAERVLELSRDYASERRQFGRLIGTYQGVSHSLADLYVELELSRSLVLWAALAADEGRPEAVTAAAAAAAKALPMATEACERAIQVHGGIGTTFESPLHLWYRRAIGSAGLVGPPQRLRRRLAATVLAGGARS